MDIQIKAKVLFCFSFIFLLLNLVLAEQCSFNPCLNGGSCSANDPDFTCMCPVDFIGIVCEQNAPSTAISLTTPSVTTTSLPHPCSFNPCRNGGYCVELGTNYECFCPPTHVGLLCETISTSSLPSLPVAAHMCSFNPCKHAGLCVSAGSDYKCYCPGTHTGIVCETLLVDIPSESSTTRQPISTTRQLTSTTRQPTSTTGQPTSTTRQPTSTTRQPTSTTRQPTSTTRQPTSTTRQPTTTRVTDSTTVQATSPLVTVDAVATVTQAVSSSSPSTTDTVLQTKTTPVTIDAVAATSLPVITPSHTQHCRVDVQFLVDSSGRIGYANFQKQLSFVEGLAILLSSKTDDIRVGVATFSSDVKAAFDLDTYNNVHDISVALHNNNIAYDSGSTNTAAAFHYARTQAFSPDHGGRDGVPNVLIALTNGQSNDPFATAQEASSLHQANVTVVAVGVGASVDRQSLDAIATDMNHVVTASNYDALKNVDFDVLQSICPSAVTMAS